VYLKDVLVRGTFGGHVWVVLPAQDVRSAFKRVMADPPTSLGMTIDLSDARVHADSHRGNQRRFTEIRTEARPKVVIQVGPTVESSGVKRQPVPCRIEERDEKRKPDNDKNQQ
jgi:hypothetical protein